jgi:hypothetical protein
MPLIPLLTPVVTCYATEDTRFELLTPLFTILNHTNYYHTIIYHAVTRLHNYNRYASVTTVT